MGRRFEYLDRRRPIDGAIVGRQVFVLLAMIVMKMHGRNEIVQRRKTFINALVFLKIREIRVPNIKIETQSGKARFINECAKITGIAHFAGGVLDADSDARVMRVQDQVLERAERGVALAGVCGFARAAHVRIRRA